MIKIRTKSSKELMHYYATKLIRFTFQPLYSLNVKFSGNKYCVVVEFMI